MAGDPTGGLPDLDKELTCSVSILYLLAHSIMRAKAEKLTASRYARKFYINL